MSYRNIPASLWAASKAAHRRRLIVPDCLLKLSQLASEPHTSSRLRLPVPLKKQSNLVKLQEGF